MQGHYENGECAERTRRAAQEKAAADFESEPGYLPSHSLRTTLVRRQIPTTGTGHSLAPGEHPEFDPGETRGDNIGYAFYY